MGLLEKVTLNPGDVGPNDIASLHAAGVSDQAIEDALYVCAYFNIIDRIADSLDFEVPSTEFLANRAAMLLEHGYEQAPRAL